MSKHTKGPWRLSTDMHGIGNQLVDGVEDAHGLGVANCGVGGLANAKLIVASPTMFDFIRSIALDDDCCTCSLHSWFGDGHASQCIQEQAGAIIREILS